MLNKNYEEIIELVFSMKNMFKIIVVGLMICSLGGCSLATHPGEISPLPILKDNKYTSLDCKELNVRNISNSEELETAVGTQLRLHKSDEGFGYGSISAIIVLPMLFLLLGVEGDDEQKINRIRELKANDKSIRIAAAEKECFLP